jgi:hypothetical protein
MQIVSKESKDVPLALRARMWYINGDDSEHSSRALRDVLNNKYHDRWIGTGGRTLWPPLLPDLNPLEFYLWGHLKPLCMQLLLTIKRHFIIALQMPAILSATTLASLNGCGGPWWDVSWRKLNLAEDIFSLIINIPFHLKLTNYVFPDIYFYEYYYVFYGCVTNNNVFWIGWLDLLTSSLQ